MYNNIIRKLSTSMTKNNYRLMFDGGSRGNPGICGAGAVLYKNNKEIWSASEMVSKHNTNNFAEYKALLLGLHKAVELNINTLHVQGDSQLILNQVYGNWNVKNETLKQLHTKAKLYNNSIQNITYEHIGRKFNIRADELANNAMDNYNSNS